MRSLLKLSSRFLTGLLFSENYRFGFDSLLTRKVVWENWRIFVIFSDGVIGDDNLLKSTGNAPDFTELNFGLGVGGFNAENVDLLEGRLPSTKY